MAGAGGALFGTLSSLRDGGSAQGEAGIDLTSLNGQDTDVAIQTIVGALTPENGDAYRIRVAMSEALSECLEGLEVFDFSAITDDMLVDVMLAYTRKCIAQQIISDSRDAFAKARATGRVQQAEKDFRELVAAATEKHLGPLLSGKGKTLDGPSVRRQSGWLRASIRMVVAGADRRRGVALP